MCIIFENKSTPFLGGCSDPMRTAFLFIDAEMSILTFSFC